MKVQDLNGVNPHRRLEKQSSVEEIRDRKIKNKESSNQVPVIGKSDQVEISQEAQELQERQRNNDEIGVSKELLSKLPSARAHIIYEALAKIKAGLYSSDEIVEEAASKLLQSGELKDIV